MKKQMTIVEFLLRETVELTKQLEDKCRTPRYTFEFSPEEQKWRDTYNHFLDTVTKYQGFMSVNMQNEAWKVISSFYYFVNTGYYKDLGEEQVSWLKERVECVAHVIPSGLSYAPTHLVHELRAKYN